MFVQVLVIIKIENLKAEQKEITYCLKLKTINKMKKGMFHVKLVATNKQTALQYL